MKKIFYVFLFAVMNLVTQAQEITWMKQYPQDSIVSCHQPKMLKTSDGNLLIADTYQRSYTNGATGNIIAIKTTISGDTIWQKNIKYSTVPFIRDIYERNGKYYVLSTINIKPGAASTNYPMIDIFSENGELFSEYIDSSENKKNSRNPGYIIKQGDGLTSINITVKSITDASDTAILIIKRYDLEGRFQKVLRMDTLNLPNLESINQGKLSLLDNDIIGFSFSCDLVSNKITAGSPIKYYTFDTTGNLIKQFSVADTDKNYGPSEGGTCTRLENGNYILTGKLFQKKKFCFVRMVDPVGKLVWEDSLFNEPISFAKIIEDDKGNIIVGGSEFIKADNSQSPPLIQYYNLIIAYTSNGTRLFKYTWGDSTSTNSFSDIAQVNGSYIVTGVYGNMPFLAGLGLPLSVEEKTENITIQIYPNPASTFVVLPDSEKFAGTQAYIYNVYGAEVLRAGAQAAIDISSLAPGVYYIRINDKSSRFVKAE